MEAGEWSETSLIYCWGFGLIFEHLSWFIFCLLGQNRKFIVKTDYSRIYAAVFSLILSSVITVFGLAAGNYCLNRLQPNIHTHSLCLSLLI